MEKLTLSNLNLDAGDYLKLETDLEQQIKIAKLNIFINEYVLEFVKKKLKEFKKDFDKKCPQESK